MSSTQSRLAGNKAGAQGRAHGGRNEARRRAFEDSRGFRRPRSSSSSGRVHVQGKGSPRVASSRWAMAASGDDVMFKLGGRLCPLLESLWGGGGASEKQTTREGLRTGHLRASRKVLVRSGPRLCVLGLAAAALPTVCLGKMS